MEIEMKLEFEDVVQVSDIVNKVTKHITVKELADMVTAKLETELKELNMIIKGVEENLSTLSTMVVMKETKPPKKKV